MYKKSALVFSFFLTVMSTIHGSTLQQESNPLQISNYNQITYESSRKKVLDSSSSLSHNQVDLKSLVTQSITSSPKHRGRMWCGSTIKSLLKVILVFSFFLTSNAQKLPEFGSTPPPTLGPTLPPTLGPTIDICHRGCLSNTIITTRQEIPGSSSAEEEPLTITYIFKKGQDPRTTNQGGGCDVSNVRFVRPPCVDLSEIVVTGCVDLPIEEDFNPCTGSDFPNINAPIFKIDLNQQKDDCANNLTISISMPNVEVGSGFIGMKGGSGQLAINSCVECPIQNAFKCPPTVAPTVKPVGAGTSLLSGNEDSAQENFLGANSRSKMWGIGGVFSVATIFGVVFWSLRKRKGNLDKIEKITEEVNLGTKQQQDLEMTVVNE